MQWVADASGKLDTCRLGGNSVDLMDFGFDSAGSAPNLTASSPGGWLTSQTSTEPYCVLVTAVHGARSVWCTEKGLRRDSSDSVSNVLAHWFSLLPSCSGKAGFHDNRSLF